jgi:hypothetical protein
VDALNGLLNRERNLNNIPKGLQEYLDKQIEEGNETYISYSEDDVVIYITPSGLKNWIVVCSYYDGQEDYSITNITGRALALLDKLIQEAKGE